MSIGMLCIILAGFGTLVAGMGYWAKKQSENK